MKVIQLVKNMVFGSCVETAVFKCKGLSIIFFLLLGVFTPHMLSGQNKCFVILDSLSNNPIPYCNVLVNELGLVSNHEGAFCVSQKLKSKEIVIQVSNISYVAKVFKLNKSDSVAFLFLTPKSHDLESVEINWSKYRFDWLGNPIKQSDGYINLWRFCQLGIGIKPTKKNTQIMESVKVPVYNNSAFKVPFRLHIYQITTTGHVGVELLPENVYGQLLQDSDEIELDVLKYQIALPAEGVFVCIELLSNKKPEELALGSKKYYEKDNNRIAYTLARYRHRNMLKLSSWKPNSYYVESYPFTNVEGMVGRLPMIKVKVRRLKE